MSKTSLQLPLWTLILTGLAWTGALVSQSLVDLVDTLVILTALIHAASTYQWSVLSEGFKPAWLWPLWIAVIVIGLYLNVGTENSKAWVEFLEWRWVLTFLSFIYLFRHVPNLENQIPKISVTLLILNVLAVYLYFQSPQARAGGVGNAIMAFSHSMGVMFCLWFYQALFILQKRFTGPKELTKKLMATEMVHVAVLLTAGFLILQTMTRGVWIGVGVGILLTSFFVSKKYFLGLVISGLLAIGLLYVVQPKYIDRILSRGASDQQSNSERIALWRGNWRIIQDNPVWGVGFQQNKHHLRKYYDEMGYPAEQRISHAHNQYLQIWAGTGTVGLLFFLFFCGRILQDSRRAAQSLSPLSLGAMAALVCFMVGALTEANFNIAKNRMLFLMVAALVVVLSRESQGRGKI